MAPTTTKQICEIAEKGDLHQAKMHLGEGERDGFLASMGGQRKAAYELASKTCDRSEKISEPIKVEALKTITKLLDEADNLNQQEKERLNPPTSSPRSPFK